MSIKVFISYSSKDDGKLKHIEAVFAEFPNFDRPTIVAKKQAPGKSLTDLVRKGINESDYVVPILTEKSITTQWINQEIGYANGIGRQVIPVVQEEIFSQLKGFIHNQLQWPFQFGLNANKSVETRGFKKAISDLLKHIESIRDLPALGLPASTKASEPRTISRAQRISILKILLDHHNQSPKFPMQIVVEEDNEAIAFANDLKDLLVEAGYAKRTQEITRIKNLELTPHPEDPRPRRPDLLAIFSSKDSTIPQPTGGGPPSIMIMTPTASSIARGDLSEPVVYRKSDNVNDILHGLQNVLGYAGIRIAPTPSKGLLRPGQVGFLVPKQDGRE